MNSTKCHQNGAHYAGLMAILAGFVLCFTASESDAARVVAEKRECAICHIAWMADFKRDDVKTLTPYEPRPIVETGRQDVVSTERMCYSCHDGFVLDSRFLWLSGEHTHPVGMVPSERVSIPKEEGKTIFPLNDDGKVYCGTCHSAHGVEWGDKLSPVFLRARNVDSSLCMTCHVDRRDDKDGQINHPLKGEVPKQAKKLLNSGSKFTRNSEVICQSCHRVHGSQGEKLLVVQNDRSQLCANCHKNKTNKSEKGKAEHFTHPVDVIPKDAKIPDMFAESGSRFGPENEVVCQTCHEVHLAASEKLLVLDGKHLKNGICVNCHKDKRTILTSGHNLLRKDSKVLSKDQEGISPNLGICGVCHQVHDGKGPKMWARNLISSGDRIASLCLSCHTNGATAEKHTVGKYSHPVGAKLPSKVNVGDLPLFTSSGVKTHSTRYGLVSCPTCHDVHGPASKLKQIIPDKGLAKGVGKYLRKGEGDLLTLCKTCHKDKWSIADTKHDLNIKNQASKPLGVCGNCHQVHNGKGPRMWAREGDLNEKDLGTLCLNCHVKDGLAEKKTPGSHSHPIGIGIEKAGIKVTRRGWVVQDAGKKKTTPALLPLYDKNGEKLHQGSGAVACATCHDPHQWSAVKKARSEAGSVKDEGDATNSFLRIPAAPGGELCITCHGSKATVLGTDHDMSVTVPETENALGEGLDQSGICGQCHAVHNAVQDLVLWGRLPGPAANAPEMLCRSCHLPGEIAQKKVPEKALHPGYVMAWDGELRDPDKKGITHLPVFDENGLPVKTGYITCPTCHNVHQWRSGKADKGPGVNEEGDVFSSFLRMESSEEILCADCHGIDAIFRYKYFHGVDFRNRDDE